MAALSLPAWRVEAFFFLCGVPFWWHMQIAIYLCRRLSQHDQVLCHREIAQTQCSRFHTAIWLGKCQSILTQTQHSSELAPFGSTTCSHVGPVSLGWPLAPLGGSSPSGHSLSQEGANRDRSGNAPLNPPHLRWRRDALQPPEVQRDHLARNTCAHIRDGGLRCISWNTRGLLGSPASSQHSRERKHAYLTRLARYNDICLQETHGKDEFLQAVQVLVPQFRLFGTLIPNNESAGGSAIFIHENLLPDGAIVTHVTTCQGRDHIVTTRSGDCVLVVVNVHFEPDLTWRGLRERLRRISPHWPCYPGALGVIIGW